MSFSRLKHVALSPLWGAMIKAGLLGFIWAVAPFHLFLLAALFTYFVPWFRPGQLLGYFAVVLLLAFRWDVRLEGGELFAFTTGGALWIAIFMGLILAAKDLVIVRREAALRALALGLIFFLSFELFLILGAWRTPLALLSFAPLALGAVLLGHHWTLGADLMPRRRMIRVCIGLLLAEGGFALGILPIAATLQAALFLLLSLTLFEIADAAAKGNADWKLVTSYFSALFLISAFVLAFATWRI